MKRWVLGLAVGGGALAAVVLVAALYLVTLPLPPMPERLDVFGFEAGAQDRNPTGSLPAVDRYPARDGEQLAYRFYDSVAEVILVFVRNSPTAPSTMRLPYAQYPIVD